MPSTFVDILVAVLFAVFAIATIVFIFAVAGHVFNEIIEAFQRSTLGGVGLLSLCAAALVAMVFAVRFATPYVVMFYRQITS